MRFIACAGAGFLLAVLWFDLMFDVQVRGHAAPELPGDVLESISTYYARVTTGASPMNRLVAFAMLATIAALVAELVQGELATWRSAASLVLVAIAVGLAGARTVGNAVRLGTKADDATVASALARLVLRDHLVCISAVAGALALQLLPA